jgi:diguanylate cyclase (GGDEF)-like protein
MWRRTALVISLLALLIIAAIGWSAVHELAVEHDSAVDDRLSDAAHDQVRELQSRLQAADALLQNLTAGDAGPAGVSLRQRVLASDCFRELLLVPWKQAWRDDRGIQGASTGLPALPASDRLKLSGAQSLVKVLATDEGRLGVYLLHRVNVGGAAQVGFLEVSPAWLWRGAEQLPATLSMLIVDPAERVIYQRAPLPHELYRMFASVTFDERDPTRTLRRDWQQDGAAWRGALLRLDPQSVRVSGLPWNVVVYDRIGALRPALLGFAAALWPWLVLIVIGVAAATRYLVGRWQPVLSRFDAALAALRQGQFERVSLAGAADTPRAVARSYNRAIAVLEQQFSAASRLAEIDRLLLEAVDLEARLEPILQRVCAVTAAQVAAVALIDRDAPGHARSFLASADGATSPVSRINLEAEIIQSLQDAPQGISVQPHHLERYSFLEPLRALGADVCHVWPLIAGNEVAAMLSVGYRGTGAPPQQAHDYGAECALRLQLALSNQTRDERLYRQAHFDSLTSLPNRMLFRDRLSQELADAADGSQRGALLYVDLDHFKKVNDAAGHSAGDQLLTIVAQRLRACVKDGDTVARLGGDEFTIILRHLLSAEAAGEIAQRIIDSVQRPVNIAGRDHQVRASIGITLFPDDGASIDELLRNADLAMYQAKDIGRSRAVFFDRKMARSQLSVAESGLFRALRRREFSLHYQPQYDLNGGDLVGLEALLRWQSPRDGLRFPNDFVPAAEQSGLIVDIGRWVLESACHQLAMWRDQGIAPARLAINVSVQQLRVGEFAELVGQILQRTGLPPQMLELEVTESVFAEEDARHSLRQLAALGIRVALDDFGTGYSSLNDLRQHPVHAIKIDRSFTHEVPDNAQAATLTGSIIDMAHALGKAVVAEGVETPQQLEFLRRRGCDMAQGFVLCRPLSVADVNEQLAQHQGSALLQRAG